MDRVGLETLAAELRLDAEVARGAARRAAERFGEAHPGHLEACGFELNRLYNVLEKAFERVCVAFENHFEKRGDYHERLLERIALDIPGVRPPFLPTGEKRSIRELKSFRHLFRHAYDIDLREDRLAELVKIAGHAADCFPLWIETFAAAVQTAPRED